VNSVPHIGHAFEFIIGDSISRYLKHQGENVFFNTGLDEHGLKVYTKSQELGISVYEHIDGLTSLWKEFCVKFQIDYDNFYKTSDAEHHRKVKIVWNSFIERGDIYKKIYKGKYCIGCESFKLDKDLIDGKCFDHPSIDIIDIEEENYFFKLSKYKEILFKWISDNPEFLVPSQKLTELKNLIINSEDISVSRLKENCPWGVDVPDDDTQVIYVWFDALLNYVFAAGYLSGKFKWQNVIQICGTDNLRFQAIIFQSFLESEGIKKSDKLLVHGTILDKNGRKISKSTGNVIDPIEQLEKYGIEAVRYYALAGLLTYSDSSWNEEDIVKLYNADVCNDWGNLVSRVLHLIDLKCSNVELLINKSFKLVVDGFKLETDKLWREFKIKDATQKTNDLVKFANKYINDEKPWSNPNYLEILGNLYYLISIVNDLYYPIFPEKYNVIKEAIIERKKVIIFKKLCP